MTSLVKKIDRQVAEAAPKFGNQKLGTFVIFVKDRECLADELLDAAEKDSLKQVSLCIGAPPKDYDVAEEADVTVVIYEPGVRRNPVAANFALRKGELDEEKIKEIVAALAKALAK